MPRLTVHLACRTLTRTLVLALLLAGAGMTWSAPADAAEPTRWVCGPVAAAQDPCRASLATTVYGPDGRVRRIDRPRRPARPAVDCFYVYPTVTRGDMTLAEQQRDPIVRYTTRLQASRYATTCRVFAPAYRQLNLAQIADANGSAQEARDRAYADVRGAWRTYLRRHNRGRGVVVIGHSQGTAMTRRLVAQEIDERPAVRRRLVSALLLGGNLTVRTGRRTGGDFHHVPSCTRADQPGCVVAFSAYSRTPALGSVFGTVAPLEATAGLGVLCSSPGRLIGGRGALTPYGLGKPLGMTFVGQAPATTPWVAYEQTLTGRCTGRSRARVLQVAVTDQARGRVVLEGDDSWGLHLGDANLALGELTAPVRRQARAYRERSTTR